jgi:hypothetical protein
VNENPWCRLRVSAPYVLPDDEPLVRAFNKRKAKEHPKFLHIDDILPEPFVGAPEAPVVLLSNNPGFGKGAPAKKDPAFMDRMRKNLLHEPSDWPFVFLAPDFSGPGKEWWERKLKHLLCRCGREVVARSILNVVYCPYPSRKFGHQRLYLPSQEYSFHLIRNAMEREAFIVFMRKRDRWLNAVKQLKKYDRQCQVKNTRNPVISPRNCSAFEIVVRAIDTAKTA